MRHETAIGAKMAAKGIVALEVEANVFISKWMNNGGSECRLIEMVMAAYGGGEEKRYSHAARALQERREQLRNDDGKGRALSADAAGDTMPAPSSPERNGAGLTRGANKASARVPAPVSAKPGHAKRGLVAIASVQAPLAKSLFDTYLLPDGRAVGNVTWKELQGTARSHAEAFRLLSLIDGYCQPSDPDAKVRDVLKEDTLREFIKIARLSNAN